MKYLYCIHILSVIFHIFFSVSLSAGCRITNKTASLHQMTPSIRFLVGPHGRRCRLWSLVCNNGRISVLLRDLSPASTPCWHFVFCAPPPYGVGMFNNFGSVPVEKDQSAVLHPGPSVGAVVHQVAAGRAAQSAPSTVSPPLSSVLLMVMSLRAKLLVSCGLEIVRTPTTRPM